MFDITINYLQKDKIENNIEKIPEMINSIKDLSKSDIICFIDGYDVLINSNAIELIEKFKEYKHDLVLSSELNCYPSKYKKDMDNLYIENTCATNYKYINSGGYIGYKNEILKLLTWSSNYTKYEGSDQNMIGNADVSITIDHTCQIFQCMCFVSWQEISFTNGRMYNNILKTQPCFIHFSGNSYQTTNGENGMEIFIEKMKESAESAKCSDIVRIKNKPTRFGWRQL